MLTVYTPVVTERIVFILDVAFAEHLGMAYRLTDSMEAFREAPSPKISYAPAPVCDEVFFWQHPIAVEKEIKQQTITCSLFEGEPVFFLSPDDKSLLPFDIFGMCFYLLTRYEEYLPFAADAFGRFPATESLAYQAGFLEKPLVDILFLKMGERLSREFPELIFRKRHFNYIASYDIDNAFACKHRGFVRTTGGLLRQMLKGCCKEVKNRIAVLRGKKKDPCDSYDFIRQLQTCYGIESYFFILYAGRGRYDKGISPRNKRFQELIKTLSLTGIIGIHPSFASASSRQLLSSETNTLSLLLNKPITSARSHFLLLRFPDTYSAFLEQGISNDFTMGYADCEGFRASTSHAFPFFDLTRNACTGLRIHPFMYMDETLRRYRQLSPEASLPIIYKLIDEVRNVGGTFVSLWHNDTFGRTDGEQWKDVYEQSIRHATSTLE